MKNETTNDKDNAADMPSINELAMLAATAGQGPEEALRLWLKTKKLMDEIGGMEEQKRREVFRLLTVRDIPFRATVREAQVFYTIEDAMKRLGIYDKRTLFNLIRWNWRHGLKPDEIERRIEGYQCSESGHRFKGLVDTGIPDWLIEELKRAQKSKRKAAAQINKVNAGKKRRRRKPVK